MNATILLLLALCGFFLSYKFYATFLQDKIFKLETNLITPAHQINDGLDYVPTRKSILFGHHFATIAGLGPILGPAIGVIWGWLPAFLWIVFGSIFLGAVHDFSILIVSLKNKGLYIGELAEKFIGKRVKIIFQVLVFFMLSLAMGVFVLIIAILFNMYKEAVIPTLSLIFIAIIIGILFRKYNLNLITGALIGLILISLSIILGVKYPIVNVSQTAWICILLFYAYFASVLPVWLLLQPRDYLNAYLLFFGLISMFLGILIIRPEIVAPAINNRAPDLPPLFPFLFITIACGAISGFHNLASSGTTVRQLDRTKDAKLIGYGGMLTEGLLATLVLIAVSAGITKAKWFSHYESWAKAGGLQPKLEAFITGASSFLSKLGIPTSIGQLLLSIMVVSFALTTLDSATRLLRYNVEELSRTVKFKYLQNRFISTLIAIAAIGYFALMKAGNQPIGLILWKLFGSTNQLLAALGLLVITMFVIKNKSNPVYVFIPMLFILTMTIWAIIAQLINFIGVENKIYSLIILSILILFLTIWLLIETIISYLKLKKN